MRKLLCTMLVAVSLITGLLSVAFAADKGGLAPCLATCCFGPRAGLEMNEGRKIRIVEWITLVPYAGSIARLYIGFEAMQGKTMSEIAAEEKLN